MLIASSTSRCPVSKLFSISQTSRCIQLLVSKYQLFSIAHLSEMTEHANQLIAGQRWNWELSFHSNFYNFAKAKWWGKENVFWVMSVPGKPLRSWVIWMNWNDRPLALESHRMKDSPVSLAPFSHLCFLSSAVISSKTHTYKKKNHKPLCFTIAIVFGMNTLHWLAWLIF